MNTIINKIAVIGGTVLVSALLTGATVAPASVTPTPTTGNTIVAVSGAGGILAD